MAIWKFIMYNNTVPIVLGVLFMSSGLVFAANEEVREFVSDSVYQAEEKVVSIDNSYISNKNLGVYSPKVSINSVTEDIDFYYIHYTFITIALSENVWQDVAQSKTMQVARDALGQYTDLGVYVTEQLKQLVDREIAYLKEVQGIERKQVTSKVVATAYTGLIGQFIDGATETLPGYTPLVSEPEVEYIDPVEVAKAQKDDVVPFDFEAAANNSNNSSNSSGETESTPTGPVITILGANPARIPLNASYSDLGAVTTSQEGVTLGLSISLSLNGEDVTQVSIDTSTVSDWSVGYSVTNQDGNTGFAERVVIVYDPNPSAETATTTETVATTTEEVIPEETATSTSELIPETPVATTTPEQASEPENPAEESVTEDETTTAPEETVELEPEVPAVDEETTSATSTES